MNYMIAWARTTSQLDGPYKSTYRSTLIELCARCNIYGGLRISHSYLADKRHIHERTTYRHILILEEIGVIKKHPGKWKEGVPNEREINEYIICHPMRHNPPSQAYPDKLSEKLPKPQRQFQKFSTIQEDLARAKVGLQFWTMGSEPYRVLQDDIARLEGLLKGGRSP